MTEVLIRRAAADEAETLSGLGVRTFVETFGALYRPKDLSVFLRAEHSVEAYRSFLDDAAYAAWLVERDGVPVGYAITGPCHLPAPDMPESAGELSRVYLTKEAQGGGVGRKLVGEALAWLDARYPTVFLSVWSANYRAQRLYASLGFAKVHDYLFMVGEQADAEWIMRRG